MSFRNDSSFLSRSRSRRIIESLKKNDDSSTKKDKKTLQSLFDKEDKKNRANKSQLSNSFIRTIDAQYNEAERGQELKGKLR